MWPFLVQTDGFYLPTYIVVNSLVFSFGTVWIYRRALKRGFNVNAVLDILLFAMLGCFAGARLAHVLVERPDYYLANPMAVFKFWQGGFVYYGGMIGGLLAAWVVCKVKRTGFLKHADLFSPILALGYSLGRWGCFAAGCCYGKASSLPWAVVFPSGAEAPAGIARHPTQIYSSLWELMVFFVLLAAEKRGHALRPGRIFGIWLFLHGLGRGLVEQFRDDFRGPSFFNLSVSTWVSVGLIVAGTWLTTRAQNGRKNVPSAS
jgi:phosphatidylglycerol---prolipoprotein diacylglyceryl transferase